jgi:outer membrane protein assembly factor BamA
MTIGVVIFSWILLAGTLQESQQSEETYRVEQVQIRGNRRVPAETIRYNLLTKPGDRLQPDMIRRDVKALYALGHFDDIRVDMEQTDQGSVIVFIVQEKPLIRSVKYEGLTSITNSEILEKLREKKMSLSQESPYDPTRIKRAEAIIRALLAEKGHQDVSVETITESIPPNRINITFKVDEGPKVRVEDITIEGNDVFTDRTIKRAMKLIKEASPLTVFSGKDTYHDLKLADDITRIRMLYAEHGYVRANVLDPVIEIRPRRVFRTLPLIRAPFPWGIPVPGWTKTIDRYYHYREGRRERAISHWRRESRGRQAIQSRVHQGRAGSDSGRNLQRDCRAKELRESKETVRCTRSHQFHGSTGARL